MTLILDKKTLRNYKLKKLLYTVLNYLKEQKVAYNQALKDKTEIRIYGIHKTLLIDDELNDEIVKDINKHKEKSIILFLEFDKNEDRINIVADNVINKIGKYPIIYMNDKKEGKLVYVITSLLSKLHKKEYSTTYLDDNQFNLDDAKKYADKLDYKLTITKI